MAKAVGNNPNEMSEGDHTSYDKDYFDNNGQAGDRPALKMYARILQRYITSPGAQILDYGAGVGYLSKWLSNYYTTLAYDLADYCRVEIPKVSPKTTVLDSIDVLEPESLNGIITLHTLEHVSEPEDLIKKFNGLLKKGGLLFYVVPNPDGLGHTLKKNKWFAYRDKTHISLLSSEKWKSLTEESGFKILKTSSDGFWDPPYLAYIPNIVQKIMFIPTAALMVLLKRLIYPDRFGEDLIVVAEKI